MTKHQLLLRLLERLNISLPCNKLNTTLSSHSVSNDKSDRQTSKRTETDNLSRVQLDGNVRNIERPPSISYFGSLGLQLDRKHLLHVDKPRNTKSESADLHHRNFSPLYPDIERSHQYKLLKRKRPSHLQARIYRRMLYDILRANRSKNIVNDYFDERRLNTLSGYSKNRSEQHGESGSVDTNLIAGVAYQDRGKGAWQRTKSRTTVFSEIKQTHQKPHQNNTSNPLSRDRFLSTGETNINRDESQESALNSTKIYVTDGNFQQSLDFRHRDRENTTRALSKQNKTIGKKSTGSNMSHGNISAPNFSRKLDSGKLIDTRLQANCSTFAQCSLVEITTDSSNFDNARYTLKPKEMGPIIKLQRRPEKRSGFSNTLSLQQRAQNMEKANYERSSSNASHQVSPPLFISKHSTPYLVHSNKTNANRAKIFRMPHSNVESVFSRKQNNHTGSSKTQLSHLFDEKENHKKTKQLSVGRFEHDKPVVMVSYNGLGSLRKGHNFTKTSKINPNNDSSATEFHHNLQIQTGVDKSTQGTSYDGNHLSYRKAIPVTRQLSKPNITKLSILPILTTLQEDGKAAKPEEIFEILKEEKEDHQNVSFRSLDTAQQTSDLNITFDQAELSTPTKYKEQISETLVSNKTEQPTTSTTPGFSLKDTTENINLMGQTYLNEFVQFMNKLLSKGQDVDLINPTLGVHRIMETDLFHHLPKFTNGTKHIDRNKNSANLRIHLDSNDTYSFNSENEKLFDDGKNFSLLINTSVSNIRNKSVMGLREDKTFQQFYTNSIEKKITRTIPHETQKKTKGTIQNPKDYTNITFPKVKQVGASSSPKHREGGTIHLNPNIHYSNSSSDTQNIRYGTENAISKTLKPSEPIKFNVETQIPNLETPQSDRSAAFNRTSSQHLLDDPHFSKPTLAASGYNSLTETVNISLESPIAGEAVIEGEKQILAANRTRNHPRLAQSTINMRSREMMVSSVAETNQSNILEKLTEQNVTSFRQLSQSNNTKFTNLTSIQLHGKVQKEKEREIFVDSDISLTNFELLKELKTHKTTTRNDSDLLRAGVTGVKSDSQQFPSPLVVSTTLPIAQDTDLKHLVRIPSKSPELAFNASPKERVSNNLSLEKKRFDSEQAKNTSFDKSIGDKSVVLKNSQSDSHVQTSSTRNHSNLKTNGSWAQVNNTLSKYSGVDKSLVFLLSPNQYSSSIVGLNTTALESQNSRENMSITNKNISYQTDFSVLKTTKPNIHSNKSVANESLLITHSHKHDSSGLQSNKNVSHSGSTDATYLVNEEITSLSRTVENTTQPFSSVTTSPTLRKHFQLAAAMNGTVSGTHSVHSIQMGITYPANKEAANTSISGQLSQISAHEENTTKGNSFLPKDANRSAFKTNQISIFKEKETNVFSEIKNSILGQKLHQSFNQKNQTLFKDDNISITTTTSLLKPRNESLNASFSNVTSDKTLLNLLDRSHIETQNVSNSRSIYNNRTQALNSGEPVPECNATQTGETVCSSLKLSQDRSSSTPRNAPVSWNESVPDVNKSMEHPNFAWSDVKASRKKLVSKEYDIMANLKENPRCYTCMEGNEVNRVGPPTNNVTDNVRAYSITDVGSTNNVTGIVNTNNVTDVVNCNGTCISYEQLSEIDITTSSDRIFSPEKITANSNKSSSENKDIKHYKFQHQNEQAYRSKITVHLGMDTSLKDNSGTKNSNIGGSGSRSENSSNVKHLGNLSRNQTNSSIRSENNHTHFERNSKNVYKNYTSIQGGGKQNSDINTTITNMNSHHNYTKFNNAIHKNNNNHYKRSSFIHYYNNSYKNPENNNNDHPEDFFNTSSGGRDSGRPSHKTITYITYAFFYPPSTRKLKPRLTTGAPTHQKSGLDLLPQRTTAHSIDELASEHLPSPIINTMLRHHGAVYAHPVNSRLPASSHNLVQGPDKDHWYNSVLERNPALRHTVLRVTSSGNFNSLDHRNITTDKKDLLNNLPKYVNGLQPASADNGNKELGLPAVLREEVDKTAVTARPYDANLLTEKEPNNLLLLWMARPWPKLSATQTTPEQTFTRSVAGLPVNSENTGLDTELIQGTINNQHDTKVPSKSMKPFYAQISANIDPRHPSWRIIYQRAKQKFLSPIENLKQWGNFLDTGSSNADKGVENYSDYDTRELDPTKNKEVLPLMIRDGTFLEPESIASQNKKVYKDATDKSPGQTGTELSYDIPLSNRQNLPLPDKKPKFHHDSRQGFLFQNGPHYNGRSNSIEPLNSGTILHTRSLSDPEDAITSRTGWNPSLQYGPDYVHTIDSLGHFVPIPRRNLAGRDTPVENWLMWPTSTRRRSVRSDAVRGTGLGEKFILVSRYDQSPTAGLLWSKVSSQSQGIPASSDFQCEQLFGHFGHPLDCQTFFACSWGVPHRFRCPHGSLFNQRKGICDWAANVPCSDNQYFMQLNDLNMPLETASNGEVSYSVTNLDSALTMLMAVYVYGEEAVKDTKQIALRNTTGGVEHL
ncbi:hypothetical protein ElyMa_002820600 [Elysia marginata]|uniref:Chitin-binding type-2 domain-containing protein n=1 Tax=Elysia marginata TaxID=1093978 RepID=A0AAV4HUQ6_9GAST|nr:hypothetical protein ElyMa_002820600 [Elysia marginata]